MCAFDKTGTLTTDKLEVKGVCVDVERGRLLETLPEAIEARPQVALVMGGCHTVVLHDGQLLGDPIEKLFYESSNWKFNSSLKMSYNSKRSGQSVTIRLTHPFRSDLKRMCAVAKAEGFDALSGYHAVVKGAPEVVGRLLKSKPPGYDQTAFRLMKEGYRILALASKPLPAYDNQFIERDQLEGDLDFAGLLVLNCPMKKDTPQYIQILKEANFRNIMITGDNIFTAAKTGLDLGFGSAPHALFLRPHEARLCWFDIHDALTQELQAGQVENLAKSHCLCIEGPELAELAARDQHLFREVIYHSAIFARVSPDQKEQIVKELKDKGLRVLMCGDGTNDVGGLKKSDVGIALVGIKEEPSEEEKKAQKERQTAEYNEAVRSRNFAKIKQLASEQSSINDNSEFKSGDACIAAPFTNKYSNSLKCGSPASCSHHRHPPGHLHHVHDNPNLPHPHAAVHDLRLHHEHAAPREPQVQ